MYRVVYSDGEIECDNYEYSPHGVELDTADGGFLAFVPYESLSIITAEDEEARRRRDNDDIPSVL